MEKLRPRPRPRPKAKPPPSPAVPAKPTMTDAQRTTVYQMLLWLYGLKDKTYRENGHVVYYKTTLTNYITTLNTHLISKYLKASGGIHTVTENARRLITEVCEEAGKILVTIQQGVQYSDGTHQSELERLKSEAERQNFEYPNDGKELYEQFVYYVTACYWQLQFLYLRCNTQSGVGGWTQCQYGRTGPTDSTACNSTNRTNHSNRCDHCSKNSGCLQVFLTATQWDDGKTTKTNIYNGAEYDGQCPQQAKKKSPASTKCKIQPMGFPKEKLPNGSSKNGSSLKVALDAFFEDQDKSFPKLLGHLKLLQLLQASSTSTGSGSQLTAPGSWVAGDFWAFFYQLWQFWNGTNNGFKTNLEGKIKEQYGNGFTKNGSKAEKADYTDIDKVFTQLLFATHGSDNNHKSLLSLSACERNEDSRSNKCGKYLYALLSDPFHHVLQWFKDRSNITLLTFEVLQELARKLKEKLDNFKQGLEKKENNKCVNGSGCQCIVGCDLTHSVLYRYGFTFYSPMSLAVKGSDGVTLDATRGSAQKRKCSDLRDQLVNVNGSNSGLTDFIGLQRFNKPAQGQARSEESTDSPTDRGQRAIEELSKIACGLSTDVTQNNAVSSLQNRIGLSSCAATGPKAEPTPNPASRKAAAVSSSPNGANTVGSTTGSGTASPTGTVHIADNNKDGVDSKIKFGDVLKQFMSVVSTVSELAIETIGTTSQYILKELNAHHSSLLEPPCNIKECIDWLIRIGELDKRRTENNKKRSSSHNNGLFARYCILCFLADTLRQNSMALEKAIKKLTGSGRTFSTDIEKLISSLSLFIGYKDGEISSTKNSSSGIATGSYYSAYSLTAKWPTCGPGAQCRGCKGNNSCKCSTTANSKSCDGTCCHRCDIRVCAGIFIAMVPALHRALEELKQKCNEKLKDNNGNKEKSISDLKEHFTPLGYEDKDLSETTTWNRGQSPQRNLTSAIDKLSGIKESIKEALETREACYFKAIENSTAGATTAPCSTTACAKDCNASDTPRTIREMLLWLMGLPYCEGYKEFTEKLNENNSCPLLNGKQQRKDPEYFIHRQYSLVIFQLPVLFYALEADVSYLRDTFCQFTGDTEHCRTGTTQCTTGTHTHCTTGTDTHCTTGTNKNCTVLRFNYERCGHCLLRTFCAGVAVLYPVQRFLFKRCQAPARATIGSAAKSRAQANDPDKDCCAPCPTGLNDWSQLCVKGPSKDCKQGTECNSGKCCKDNKGSTACNISTPTVIRPSCQCRALYDFVCFMGFRVGKSVGATGATFHDVLKECFGDQDEEDKESVSGTSSVSGLSSRRGPAPSKNNTYVKLASCWRLSRCVLRSHCQKGEAKECTAACSSQCSMSCVQDNALSSSSCSPSTIRQMMLWLIGLPLTEAYKKDQDTAQPRASQPSGVLSVKSPSQSSSGYLFGTDGCVSNGVQCIPALKKLEENNDKAPKRGSKKGSATATNSYDRLFKHYYKETIVWMLVVFNAIEGGLTSVLCYLRHHAPGTGASIGAPDCTVGQQEASSPHVCSRFTYEFEDPSELLGAFCRYIYMVHFQLRFLLTMCSTPKADGGWRECEYSTNESAISNINALCTCAWDRNCHYPLRSFLTNNPQNKNKFQLCDGKKEHLQMGFAVRECSSSLTGAHIATVLEALIDTIGTKSSTAFTRPLSLLAQYCVAIGQLEPSSLGDLFTVFRDLGVSSMWASLSLYGQEGQTFSRTLLCELWNVFKCCNEGCKACSGACNEKSKETHTCVPECQNSNRDCAWRYRRELKESISRVMTRHKNSRTTNDSDASHRYSLSSLMCSGTTYTGVTSTVSPQSSPSPHCAPYLKSLSQGLYTYYCPTVPGAGDTKSFGVLQWLYDRLRQLLDGIKELKEAFENCKCCHIKNLSADSSVSSPPCSDIVSCPYAHPTIYSFGFMLGEPCVLRGVKGNNQRENCKGQDKKNCASFLQQLGCVLKAPEGCQKGCQEGCCKKEKCCEKEKCSVICSQQCNSVPSQESSPVSALYLAFECVIDIVYRIMLKKALLKVECVVHEWYTKKDCNKEQQQEKDCSSQNDNENVLQCQLTAAFQSYVTNAMYCSYPALICTFACQVFEKNYNKITSSVCDVSGVSQASRVHHCPCVHRAPGGAPTRRITTAMCRNRECHCSKLKDSVQCCSTCNDSKASLCISKSSVTSITPIIPQYCPTVIDPYHYKMFNRATTTVSDGTSSCATSYYSFSDALDFHVQGANCILPVPSNLRSAVDWILRVSRGTPATGASATQEKDNNCAVVCQKKNNCDVVCQKGNENDCKDGQRGDHQSSALPCDPELRMFQCLAEEISCVLNGENKDSEKKDCDQKQLDALSTCNVSSIVSQCKECNALSTCDVSSTVSSSCAQCLLRNLAQGLRTFVGYKDMTQEVKKGVCKERDKVMKEIHCLLECLRRFMCNEGVMCSSVASSAVSSVPSSKCSLSAELGNALLKAEFGLKETDVVETLIDITATITDVILGAEGQKKMFARKYFSDVLCIFTRAMTSEHKQCHSDLRCCTLQQEKNCANVCKATCVTAPADTSTNNNCVPQGLSQLCDFFQGIQLFACEWNHIGKGSASKGSEATNAKDCDKKGQQLPCCSKESAHPCQCCSKLCAFEPSSDVVFNERQKAECLPWTFKGQKKECEKEKECPQDCSDKERCASRSSSSSSSPSCSRGFFQQLQCGLDALGQCATTVSELCQIGNNGVTLPATGTEQCSAPTQETSSPFAIEQYKAKLCDLIQALKRFGEHIEGCKFGGAPQRCSSHGSCRADPSYAVDGAKKLMEETKRGVEKEITENMTTSIILGGYEQSAKERAYDLNVELVISYVTTVITAKMQQFKSHLDDLKRLCQWLHRMSQLYASGLKGFVESLVKHLEHIVQVIDWITGIERMIRRFGQDCVSNARELIDVSVFKCVPQCCERHTKGVKCEASVTTAPCEPCTNGIVTVSSSSSTASDTCVPSPSLFFDALNCRIDNLLSSYVLGPLPRGAQKENDSACSQGASPSAPGATTNTSISSDLSCLFRAFLERLRLLAIDRYTLQLWQHESCPKDRVSSIRHWSIFKDGIVRHSDLEGIKRALCCLTLMEDYKGVQECGVPCSTDCSSSSSAVSASASSSAPPSGTISSTLSTSRIHDFHAICVLQKFSFEAPLRALQCSTEGLEKIIKALQKCKEVLQPLQKLLRDKDCHSRGVTSCEDQCQATCKQECLKALSQCCKALSQCCKALSQEGICSTAQFKSELFCELYRFLCDFLSEPYGVYNLAQFLHTILGPNAFSAVIFAIRELRDILCQLLKCCDTLCSKPNKVLQCTGTVVPSNKDVCCLCRLMRRMCGIVSILNGRNHSSTVTDPVTTAQCNANDDCYSLDSVTKRLEAFVDVLKREYIFCYPVVCGTQSDKDCKAVCPGECDTECDRKCSVEHNKDTFLLCSTALVTPSHTSASSTLSLTSLPLLCAHCHVTSSICPECIPILARTFITLVPILYPQLCYLAYQCRLYWQQDHMNGYKDSALSSLMRTLGFDRKDLYDYLYIDVPFTGTDIDKVLNTETNSLRLLCDSISEPSQQSPFNTDCPFYRLYTQCLAYYQRRKNERLTDSKSTPPVMPTSLREILRFFVYLPFSAQFDALQCTMQRYCSQSCVVNFSDLFTTLMMSSAMSAVLLQLIECPQGAFLCFFDEIYTNREGYHLDSNTETLFFQLCDLSVTLYRGLKFLSLQCGTGASLAGWKDCRLSGEKGNKESDDITQPSDTQQLQDRECRHLCECIGAKDSSTTGSVLTSAAPMCLTAGPTVSTTVSHTTSCSFPLLRYLTDDCFFDSTLTVPSALRKVCLNDSCQEMIYRHMAPRGWQKEAVQCPHRDEESRDRQLEVCDPKASYSVCHLKDCDPQRCDLSKCCHPYCRAQCCAPVCSTLYGHHLFHLLRNFVGHEHDADPLLQFTRYMVSIAAWPPDSLSGYMTFMLRFSDWLRRERNTVNDGVTHGSATQKKDWNSSVLSSLHSEISLFPGEFDPNCLIDAFLRVTHCEHNNGVASSSSATSLPSSTTDASSSPSSLPTTSSGSTISVLSDCQQCQRLLRPLDYEIYDLYLPMYARRYLTWMLHFGPRLHRGTRALEKEFKRHIRESSVSQSGVSATDPGTSQSRTSQSRTSVQCHPSMLHCPFALPELHSAGLHFWDPNRMCNVSCECLLQRLQCSLKDFSPLAEFLHQCDRFLWSVRKPFYWVSMALWIVATVYLLFVHFWRLDSWRMLSHGIRSRASHVVYPKVLLAAEPEHYDYAGL